MDMTAWLDEMTYRLLVCADDEPQAAKHLAIVRHWAHTQSAQLQQGRQLRTTISAWWTRPWHNTNAPAGPTPARRMGAAGATPAS